MRGTVEAIRCYKEEDGWAAILIKTSSGRRLSVTGIMPGVRVGMTAEFTGRVVTNKFGDTLKADTFVETLPSDREGIIKYLSSGFVKNIGPVLAEKIVSTFGDKTLEVLDTAPERLHEVHGVGKKRVEAIISAAREHLEIRSIMVWLKRYDLSDTLAVRIYEAYGTESVKRLEENPYRLADDLHGVGFKRADAVALRLGVAHDSPFRLKSGIRGCLEDRADEGNTCMDARALVARAASGDYLSLPEELVSRALRDLDGKSVLIDPSGAVSLPVYDRAERAIARKLRALASKESGGELPSIPRIEKATGVSYSDEQKGAIIMSTMTNLLVITGGPGTGKTITTNAIINEFEHQGKTVLLAAPTGRAAKRMNEVTGREAKTIHRLLEYSHDGFGRNEECPLDGDALVIDESSMIDTLLMRDLLAAVPVTMKVILVGDVDQLPSVGPGSVLRDIIDSGRVPVVRLTQIYRQAQGSAIVMGAHAVNHGRVPHIPNGADGDMWLFRQQDKDAVADMIIDLVSNRIQKALGYGPADIQVLTPMRREWDPIGSVTLNARLQAALNPSGAVAARKGETEFRLGDRIMQVRNNYDKDIYNGDIGIISRKLSGQDDDKALMEALFDGKSVRFGREDLADLELAYACTVHKSQGSEYPVVVMPVHNSHFVMLKRNLLYTGITRAKRQCVLVGTDDAIANAVRREDTVKRHTMLKERIETEQALDPYKVTLF